MSRVCTHFNFRNALSAHNFSQENPFFPFRCLFVFIIVSKHLRHVAKITLPTESLYISFSFSHSVCFSRFSLAHSHDHRPCVDEGSANDRKELKFFRFLFLLLTCFFAILVESMRNYLAQLCTHTVRDIESASARWESTRSAASQRRQKEETRECECVCVGRVLREKVVNSLGFFVHFARSDVQLLLASRVQWCQKS